MSDPRTPYDGPVEQHPATAQLRAYIAALEAHPEGGYRDIALYEAREALRRFNAVEYDARARMFLSHRD